MARPTTVEVKLRDGKKVTIGELNWKAYKTLKAKLLQFASQNLTEESMIDILAIEKSDNQLLTGIQAAETIGKMLFDGIDDFTIDMIEHCIVRDNGTAIDCEELSPREIFELRDACLEVNDIQGLIGSEGNAVAAVMGRVNNVTAVLKGGGLQSSHDSLADTDGVSVM